MSVSRKADEETPPEALTPEFWSSRYKAGDCGWDLGEVSPPFAALWESGVLKPGERMLIPGCGTGWEAVYFAQRGIEVTALDFAPEALTAISRRADQAGVRIDTLCRDFLAPMPDSAECYDIVLEQTCFCAIHPMQRPHYVASAVSCLRPGGVLIGLFYHTRKRGGPPFDTDPEDVRRLFEPFFKIETFAVTPDSHPRRQNQEWLGLFRKRIS